MPHSIGAIIRCTQICLGKRPIYPIDELSIRDIADEKEQ